MSQGQVWGTTWPPAIRSWETCPLCKKKIKPEGQALPVDVDVTSYICSCETEAVVSRRYIVPLLRSMTRRNVLRAVGGVSGLLAVAPFIPFGRFLVGSAGSEMPRQKIANIRELNPNSRITFTYPRTGDREKDSDPFKRFLLVHLPNGQLKAYSMVCVHLWCLADYKPERQQIECPCHGSIYDVQTGIAFKGPAAFQSNKTLPEITLQTDQNGDIYATSIQGIVGYGREAQR